MILVTGGAGYIGSHTVVALLQAGHEVLVYDNFSTGSVEALQRVSKITGRDFDCVKGDVRDGALLQQVFADNNISSVMHFAGLKVPAESIVKPLEYYECNLAGSMILLQVMQEFGVKRMVFSSTAAVYNDTAIMPVRECDAVGAVRHPYARSKYMVEGMLADMCAADPSWSVLALRYFNPVGAHASGLLGESPQGTPTNLVPFVAQVAAGQLPRLQVFGGDYPTADGTGVRDYIHVVDLALGHLAALRRVSCASGFEVVNLGTGKGYSVLQVVAAFEAAAGRAVPYDVVARRAGDIAVCYADATYAFELLGWRAERSLAEMMEDAWRWQQR